MAYTNKPFLDIDGLSIYDTQIKRYIPITYGYYNNGTFYSNNTLTSAIIPEEKRIYVDLLASRSFLYNGTTYVEIGTACKVSATTPTNQVAGDLWFKLVE